MFVWSCLACLAFNSEWPIKCVSLNNQPCQTRSTTVNIDSHKTLFYLFTISVNKCGGSCNTNDCLYARVYVPNEVKNGNVKAFDLM